MGIEGLSAHKSGGWKAQAARLSRWYDRVERASEADRLDFFLVFCQNCHALRDWLERDGVATKQALDRFISSAQPLRICRDITNGSKHLTVSRPSVDAQFSIGRQYT